MLMHHTHAAETTLPLITAALQYYFQLVHATSTIKMAKSRITVGNF